ncbi:MAG: flavohemoglobin expression-modulating QEGLA motif protein, partial [Polyangiaceae bacterium]
MAERVPAPAAEEERGKSVRDVTKEAKENGNGPSPAHSAKEAPVPRETPKEPRETPKEKRTLEGVGGKSLAPVPIDRTPSIPPMPAAGPWRSYKEIVSQLATRIVDGQREIRVLQAIRWDDSIQENFLKSRGRELPKVDESYYAGVELGFDPKAKAEEFEAIARDIDSELGETDAIGAIMTKTALEYRDVVRMLAVRGTPLFYAYSRKLYGSPKDKFPDGKSTVRDLGHVLYSILTNADEAALGSAEERKFSSTECATELNERFARYFSDTTVRVSADDSILADAAAGNDYVKVRTGAKFSTRDIDILEVHEGWVHVATSLNGQQQTVARWLAKGPPRTTAVQEGLAALLEIFTFRTYPRRARRLNDRVLAVDKAEDGASFLDVYEWFRTEGYDEEECFHNTRRIFRGGMVEGGAPFTKDACYCKGIVLNYAFIRSAIQHNRVDLIPFLFVGKVAHE